MDMCFGPIHGDLHAQNVNIDQSGRMYLIDFGLTSYSWRTLDFLVMECALKFAASPPNALLDDLLLIDEFAEKQWNSDGLVDCRPLEQCLHGSELSVIAAAVCSVRHCARQLGVVRNVDDYMLGLYSLTAGMASIRQLINRTYVFHSLGYLALLLEERGIGH
jgi:serine/threonine protein kinase